MMIFVVIFVGTKNTVKLIVRRVRPFGAQRTKYFAVCDPLAHGEQNIIKTNCNGGPDPVCEGCMGTAFAVRPKEAHDEDFSTRWRTTNIIFTVVMLCISFAVRLA
jgi:hypothetical protein